jgi:AcrR family transcriptional regulator
MTALGRSLILANWRRMPETRTPRRRSGLHQERSRQTRQRLVRAALELWTERGFESGVEDTTVEEIVGAAGVTKGTFYFHFARKEEILLEMGWETAEIVNDEARRCLQAERGLEDSLFRVIDALTGRIRAAPPAAVARSIAEFRHASASKGPAVGRVGFGQGFELLFARAQQVGEPPLGIEPSEIARILQAMVMDSILDWAATYSDLRAALRLRASILVAGLKEPAILR